MSKFKDDYSIQVEILEGRLLTLEGRNINVSQYHIPIYIIRYFITHTLYYI